MRDYGKYMPIVNKQMQNMINGQYVYNKYNDIAGKYFSTFVDKNGKTHINIDQQLNNAMFYQLV